MKHIGQNIAIHCPTRELDQKVREMLPGWAGRNDYEAETHWDFSGVTETFLLPNGTWLRNKPAGHAIIPAKQFIKDNTADKKDLRQKISSLLREWDNMPNDYMRTSIWDMSAKIEELFIADNTPSLPELTDEQIMEEANSTALQIHGIDGTFEDGFYSGVKWVLSGFKRKEEVKVLRPLTEMSLYEFCKCYDSEDSYYAHVMSLVSSWEMFIRSVASFGTPETIFLLEKENFDVRFTLNREGE